MSGEDNKKLIRTVALAVAGVVLVSAGIAFLIRFLSNRQQSGGGGEDPAVQPTAEEQTAPEKISLQLAVDQWLDSESSKNDSGIYIYDLDNKDVVARHNEDELFYINEISAMYFAYEGYSRIDKGVLTADGVYPDTSLTRSQCLDQMIRWSYFPCFLDVANELGWDNVQTIFEDRGFKKTELPDLTSTPTDVGKFYQYLWKHPDIKESSWKTLRGTMLSQENDTHSKINWRQSLPSGFNTAKVYNKSGWKAEGNRFTIYNDAAFVEFPETVNKNGEKVPARHFVFVVLTRNTDFTELVKLGRKVENAVRTADGY